MPPYVSAPEEYAFFSIYCSSQAPTSSSLSPPNGPITAKEINKLYNSSQLLFVVVVVVVALHGNIYNNKETNLITKVITINKKLRGEMKEGSVRGVIAVGFFKI